MVLQSMSDVASLSSLIHASPSYHAVYRAMRNEVVTMVTLQEPESHDLHIQEPMSFVEICVHGGQYPDRYLRSAIADCQDQAWDHKRIQLTVLQYQALLTLVNLVGWTIHEEGPSYHITCSKTGKSRTAIQFSTMFISTLTTRRSRATTLSGS